MAEADPSVQLNKAIELANAGQRDEARALLVEFTRQYPDLELGWLWLASVTDDSDERVRYLRRVLAINPANVKARNALTRLTGSVPDIPMPAPVSSAPVTGNEPLQGRNTIVLVIAAMVVVTIAVILVALLMNSGALQKIFSRPTATSTLTPTRTRTPGPTFTPSITPGGPTFTPFVKGTLPPTWTIEPTQTPLPTNTFIPLPTEPPTASPRATVTPLPTWTPLPPLPTMAAIPSLPPSATVTATASATPTATSTSTLESF